MKVLSDSAGNHGFILSDKIYTAQESELKPIMDSLKRVGSVWHIPTDKEAEVIFKKTWSSRTLASTYTQGDCMTADEHIVIMRGREFKLVMPGYDFAGNERFNSYFLIRPF